jgi:hypothetical protein
MRWCLLAVSFAVGAAYLYTLAESNSEPIVNAADNAQMAASDLAAYINSVRQGKYNDSELYPLTQRYGTALLPHLKMYARDADPNVASQATRAMLFLLENARTPADRTTIVTCLTEMLQEGYETGCRCDVYRPLRVFSKADDFSLSAKQILHNLLARVADGTYKNPYQIQEIVLLVGIADMQSELPQLQKLIDRWDGGFRKRYEKEVAEHESCCQAMVERWAKVRMDPPPVYQMWLDAVRKRTYWQHSVLWDALRARARMGVREDIRRCIEMAESHPDPLYKAARLFGELAYLCQPEVIGYLQKYLYIDERPAPWKGDMVVYSYANYAGVALLQMLQDAPVRAYSAPLPRDIVKLREWMAEQTAWKIIR